ncbi:MAG: hypothetical protein EOP83_37080 [Verrucomicrobiaceae bacterium]|nr:MAG: hypothetical protein EOP83_37080 [Verrucomicrobiaceae bacterium]
MNQKQIITEYHLNELIPDLVKLYRRDRKDHDILSVLMILMKDGKYEPFVKSQTYDKLYSEKANYKSYIVANRANGDLTIDRAMTFYRSRVK